MKTIKNILLSCLLVAFFQGCSEQDLRMLRKGEKPDPVKNVTVESLPGAAKITIDFPNSDDMLYVLATYESAPGIKREVKTSLYKNELLVEGFASAGNYAVVLYAVAKGEVLSEPTEITVEVLTPAYIESFNSLRVLSDFGGINVALENPTQQEIILNIFRYDELTREWVRDHTRASSTAHENFSLRGYDAKETQFSFVITDRWGNHSDTLRNKFVPIHEERMDKSKFRSLNMPTDTYQPNGNNSCYQISNLWNERPDNTLNGFYNCNTFFWSVSGVGLPQHFSFDMGAEVKLSRFLYHHVTWAFEYFNPKVFELWGSNNPAVNGSDEGWERIATFTSNRPHPPSPAGTPRNQQLNLIAGQVNGEEFVVPLEAGAYRYYRWRTLENWGGSGSVHIGELTFWGGINN